MIPDTRGLTSATRSGAMRPGSSRTMARGDGLTVTTLTSGGSGGAAEATLCSLQPERSPAAPNNSSIDGTTCKRLNIPSPFLEPYGWRPSRDRRQDHVRVIPQVILQAILKIRSPANMSRILLRRNISARRPVVASL